MAKVQKYLFKLLRANEQEAAEERMRKDLRNVLEVAVLKANSYYVCITVRQFYNASSQGLIGKQIATGEKLEGYSLCAPDDVQGVNMLFNRVRNEVLAELGGAHGIDQERALQSIISFVPDERTPTLGALEGYKRKK